MQNFIYDNYGTVTAVTDEPFVKRYLISINNENFELLITEEKYYYNFYILCDNYEKTPLNCLNRQIPKTIGQQCYDDIECETILLEFYLWHKFYGFKGKINDFTITYTKEDM